MPVTGFGRGWQEPKATTLWGRVKQRLREPATTTDYIVLTVVFTACAFIATFVLAPIA